MDAPPSRSSPFSNNTRPPRSAISYKTPMRTHLYPSLFLDFTLHCNFAALHRLRPQASFTFKPVLSNKASRFVVASTLVVSQITFWLDSSSSQRLQLASGICSAIEYHGLLLRLEQRPQSEFIPPLHKNTCSQARRTLQVD